MAPKLCVRISRAAMNVELKRGRAAATKFLMPPTAPPRCGCAARCTTGCWPRGPPHAIDINRDTQLQDGYADRPHTLIVGCAWIAGSSGALSVAPPDGQAYLPIEADQAAPTCPCCSLPWHAATLAVHPYRLRCDPRDYITEPMASRFPPS